MAGCAVLHFAKSNATRTICFHVLAYSAADVFRLNIEQRLMLGVCNPCNKTDTLVTVKITPWVVGKCTQLSDGFSTTGWSQNSAQLVRPQLKIKD